MKMISKRLLPVLLLAFLFTLPALAEQKIATIDLRKVFDNYWKRQQAEVALKDRGATMDKELKGSVDDYKKTQEEYTNLLASANDQSVTPEERDKRKTSAESKLLEMKTIENTIRTAEDNDREQLESQKKRMREAILVDIRTAINAKAKAGGFSLVIDSASESFNQTPVILFTDGANDMTDAILTQLNAGAPAGSDTTKPADSSPTPKK